MSDFAPAAGIQEQATQAAAIRARRALARKRLMEYATYVAPWYHPARHHHLVAEYLEEVYRFIDTKGAEGIGRLMIFEPPRHGKTEEISRLFPSWLLGKRPDSRIILTAYGADLANEDSRAVRNYVTSEQYKKVFGEMSAVDAPVELDEESRAKANWSLAAPHRGMVVAAGIGGGIVGKGAHLLVIDDPFKNRDEANSEAYRKRVLSWYKSAAYTRLEDGGAIVVTHTRWHPDDLAGELLEMMVSDPLLADQWTILYLPALALGHDQYVGDEQRFQELMLRGQFLPPADPLGREPGEALWPEKYPAEQLARIAVNVGPHEFDAQYQQLPRAEKGNFFDEGNFRLVEKRPEGLQWFVYLDLALGESEQADFNAAMPCGHDPERGVVTYRDLLHVHELDDFLAQVASWMVDPRERGTIWAVESVAFSSLVFKQFMRDPRLANVAIMPIVPQGDKVSRARPLQTRARQGLIEVVRGPWWQAAWRELEVFPNGKHDDITDTMSGGLQMIADFGEGYGQTATSEAAVQTASDLGF